VDGRSDPADALGIDPGISGIPAGHQQLDAPEHHTCTPGIGHVSILNLDFDAQVAFDARNGVNCYSCHRGASLFGSWNKSINQ
jgi:hypothetical protein